MLSLIYWSSWMLWCCYIHFRKNVLLVGWDGPGTLGCIGGDPVLFGICLQCLKSGALTPLSSFLRCNHLTHRIHTKSQRVFQLTMCHVFFTSPCHDGLVHQHVPLPLLPRIKLITKIDWRWRQISIVKGLLDGPHLCRRLRNGNYYGSAGLRLQLLFFNHVRNSPLNISHTFLFKRYHMRSLHLNCECGLIFLKFYHEILVNTWGLHSKRYIPYIYIQDTRNNS